MPDKLHRFLLENLNVRGEWVRLDSSWQHILETSTYPPALRKLLGEATAAITLLAASLKFEGSLTLQMNNTQPVNMLVVHAKSDRSVRAIAQWEGEISDHASFNDMLNGKNNPMQSGTLVMTVEHDNNTKRYQSIIALQGDSLADTLSAYFQQSEQLPTHFQLTTNEERVAGFMLQSLPSEDDDLGWNHAQTLAETLKNDELLELDVDELLHRLYHDEDVRLFDAEPIHFKCSCSQYKIEKVVQSLGKSEADSILNEQGSISLNCQFCNKYYELDAIDVNRIFTEHANPGTGSVH